jgi:hypothetical protein
MQGLPLVLTNCHPLAELLSNCTLDGNGGQSVWLVVQSAVIDEIHPLDIVGCNLLRNVAGTLLYCSELTEWCVVLCVAFVDVSDENKAFVGSISIVHVVLSVGLLICEGRGIALCFVQKCIIMFQVWRCHCARVHLLSSIGGTLCKNLRLFYTLDSVLNCYNCFLVEYYKT